MGKGKKSQRAARPVSSSSLPVPEEVAATSGAGWFLVFVGAVWFLFNQVWGSIFLVLVILVFLSRFQVAGRFKKANRAREAGRYVEAARHLEEVRLKKPGLNGLKARTE